MNEMRLQDLRARIAHAQYTVDPDAVAAALLTRRGACELLGLTAPASGEAVLVAREVDSPTP